MTRGGKAKERTEPERRCIATGDSGGTGLMLRFVLGPDGRVTPDLAERLPGRGVWLTAERALVDRAVAKNLFARAFRRQVAVPEALADLLERLLTERLVETVALARKAGQAVTGYEKTRALLGSGAAGALIQARDGAAGGREKVARLAGDVPVIDRLDAGELGLAFGREFAIHAALERGGLAERALRESVRLSGLRPAELDRMAGTAMAQSRGNDGAVGGPEQDDQ